jgi:iron(III) transport system permease protein
VSTFTPVVTAFTFLGIRSLPRDLEEAALVVAGPIRTLWRISVGAARREIALGALLVFVLVLDELGVCSFLRVDVYPTAVFARAAGFGTAPGEAVALSLPLVAIAAAVTAIDRRIAGRSVARVAPDGPSSRLALGPVPVVLACLAAAWSIGPLAALGWVAAPALGRAAPWIGSSLQNSLVIAGATAAFATPAGLVVGHALARRRANLGWLDTAALFAFVVPSAVLGGGVVRVWNRPATEWLYASEAVLVLALVARYGVLSIRTFAAACTSVSSSYEEAATVASGDYLRRLFRVVLPMNRRAVLAAFALVLVFCLRDVDTAILFYPPGGEPLTVRIFTLEANGPPSVVAALAALQATMSALILFGAWRFFDKAS